MARSGPKLGVFGGTFDPVHLGHLRPVEEVAEALRLDRVLFVLSARPPHKGGKTDAPAEDRWRMLQLALEDNPRFVPSDLELRRPGPSYAVDTLEYLMGEHRGDLYFILGEDAFREIETWKDYKKLLGLCHLAVMRRTEEDLEYLLTTLGYKRFSPGVYLGGNKKFVFLTPVTPLEVSATMVRDLVRTGRSIRYLVPEPVRGYILERGLYRDGEAARP